MFFITAQNSIEWNSTIILYLDVEELCWVPPTNHKALIITLKAPPHPPPNPPNSLLPRSRVPLSQASFQGFVFLSVRKIEAFGRSFLNLLSNIKTHIHPHQDSTHHLLLLFPGTYTTIDFLYFKLLPHKLHHVIIQQSLWDSFLAPASALSLCSSWA